MTEELKIILLLKFNVSLLHPTNILYIISPYSLSQCSAIVNECIHIEYYNVRRFLTQYKDH